MKKLFSELKMKHKLFILFLLVASAPMLITSFFLYTEIKTNLNHLIMSNTENAKIVVDSYFNNKADQMLSLAQQYAEHHDLAAALEQDNHMSMDYRITPIYTTLKKEGKITGFEFYNSKGILYTQAQRLCEHGQDKSSDIYIKEALNGNETKGFEYSDNGLVVRAATPVKMLGKIVGVCQMKLKFTDITFADMKTLLSENIDIYSHNVLILSTNRDSNSAENPNDTLGFIRRVIDGEVVKTYKGNTANIYYPLYDINKKLIAMIRIREDISNLNSTKKEISNILIWIFLFAILFSTLISFVISEKITKPIAFVAQSLAEIAAGNTVDLGKRISVSSKDEIADLINSFNQIQELEHANIEKMRDAQQKLQSLAELDGLTGAYNRRFLNEYYELEVKRSLNQKQYNPEEQEHMNFGIAILDIDNFKKINDTYGHLAGDNVLQQIVAEIKEVVYTKDVVCRYGGEEFVVIFTKTTITGVLQATERIRSKIAEKIFYLSDNCSKGNITVSIGVATFNEDFSEKSTNILKIADDRLLMAKVQGKNRVVYKMEN